jgi:hypothetical protein
MTKGKVGLGIVLGIFTIYVAAAPFITVYQMKSAAENHDGEALSEHIEFTSVRQSMKDQMNVMLAQRMVEDDNMKDNPFAAMGAAFVGGMVDNMLNAYITPAGITQLMAGEKPQLGAEKGDEVASSAERDLWKNTSMSYKSFDKFVIEAKSADGKDGKFILRRQGFGWKLTEIIIPMK